MAAVTKNPASPLEDQLCYSIYSAGMAIQRLYKPLLDELGLTYPQYLVLSVLWREDEQTVSALASSLALESSTLTPLLKRLETAGLITRRRNPSNERQVLVSLTAKGAALRERGGCLGAALGESSGRTADELAELNAQIRSLRDRIYETACTWDAPI